MLCVIQNMQLIHFTYSFSVQMSELWLSHTTFSPAPRQFVQLFSIHGLYRGSVYPLIYTFMTRRTQAMYQALLSFIVERATFLYQLDLDPRNIATDFEIATINAFKAVFPGVVVTGCHFHLGQSVLRKVNELGLKATYRSDPEFALHSRMCMAWLTYRQPMSPQHLSTFELQCLT